ncbi:hypothetical protein E3Q18_01329 [Wallemia mellicola]|uniref:Uncharacterized protein n=1 Tax=Wallemia mellicola TaxID=1708541 RepID=A0A4T0RN56_9BASI|nr:hypothetical protein E3Q23_02970 [Wallemia mellicola]TIB75265.1 hypothetical protein E3Q24_00014 [Wallemia mellicola]TIB98296.1 hypothetical protein E3Q17_03050 [Wallemia mellicola]TIC00115.1 hypothetical protein E3Q18_01329 [Wallemia mellicola]TIC11826.1 hypothetical protein E3Q15_02536 [Wallemia mellicola]
MVENPGQREHFESIDRLFSIPLVKDTLDFSNDLLHKYPLANSVWERGYNVAVGVSSPIVRGPLHRPVQVLDVYSLQLLKLAESFWPYPFNKHGGEIYNDVKQPIFDSRERLNNSIITPILMQIENFVHRFIPSQNQSNKNELSPTKRTIILKNEVTDYLSSVSTEQLNRLRQSNDWIDKSADYVSNQAVSFKQAILDSRTNVEERTNELLTILRNEKEKVEERAKKIPEDSRRNVTPAFNKLQETYNDLSGIAANKEFTAKEKAMRIGDYINDNAVPVLRSLQEAVTKTESELQKAVNEQVNHVNHVTEKNDEKKVSYDKPENKPLRASRKA